MSTSGTVTIQDEVVSPLAHKEYIILNGKFVFDLLDVCQEHNPGVKQELPVEVLGMWKETLFLQHTKTNM
jgi:hypothetical protein